MYGVNGSSDAISRDMNSLLYSATFKHPADGEFAKIKQLISLDPYPSYDNQNQSQNQNQNQNRNQQERDERPIPEAMSFRILSPIPRIASRRRGFSRYMNSSSSSRKESESDVREFLRYTPSSVDTKQERKEAEIQSQDLPPPSSTAAMNGSRRVPNLPLFNNSGSYGYTNQSSLDCASPYRAMDSKNSNLLRQNSTPAGFLSSLTADNGFASMKKGGSSTTLNNHISFSLGSSSSSSIFLPQIAENENELQESQFSSMKRGRNGVLKMSQNGETGRDTPNLVHHMSLPKTSSEMAGDDSFLHFQHEAPVPWKARAKRGFATHPRSIAERERRTRISERIKRLQELFPDIDKQTNTADMLDMAVEYIKNLQKELQNLNDARERCRCSAEQLQSYSTK
ncbi:hypothetical protein SSX86_028237 [Deinandra increscens subsp. villosa]|uniref:BHLH domain-containing protein n=1 Tax=Deinandra increscens subsp. villosa TaxID=3103831 RepID=A0AAP0C8C2_9ASTR